MPKNRIFAPITVPVAELEAVVKWTGVDPKRPHLHVVAFRAGEYIACDGHRLVRVPCDTHDHAPFGLDRTAVSVAVAAHRATSSRREIDLAPSVPTGDQTDGPSGDIVLHVGPSSAPSSIRVTVRGRSLEDFPTTEVTDKLMDLKQGSDSLDDHGFDPAFLAGIAEVHAADRTPGNHGVRVVAWSMDRHGGVLFRNGKGIRFLVMPVRLGQFI
jgi:hypothetical protein